MTAWHERDDFWEKLAPFMFPKARWGASSDEVDQILDLLVLGDEVEILDLCCGPGRHCLEFARRGCQVTGVDRTSLYIHQARQKAEEENLQVEFVQQDMRNFNRAGSFDATILMFTSFGYFEDHEENLKVLSNVWNSLRDGGKILVDVMGKEVLARIFQPQGWEEIDGVFWLQERKINSDWSRMHNRWIVIESADPERTNSVGASPYEVIFEHWLYSAVELIGMLEGVGFGNVNCFGDLSGSEYGVNARRLVCVGQK